jgi:hypothetical protein
MHPRSDRRKMADWAFVSAKRHDRVIGISHIAQRSVHFFIFFTVPIRKSVGVGAAGYKKQCIVMLVVFWNDNGHLVRPGKFAPLLRSNKYL